MKKKWLLLPVMAAAFASCEKQEPTLPPATPTAERKTPAPTKIEPVDDPSPASPPASADTSGPASDAAESPAGSPGKSPSSNPPRADGIPVAKSVEGQPGFVFSPYNDKVVDVRGMPPGMLVADPTFPASEKKHFRLPP